MFAHIIPSAASASSTYYYTISANDTGVDLWADIVADNGGVAPSQSIIQVTINAGVEIGAASNSSPTNYALDISSSFSGKTLFITNNGYIGGFGGDGGAWSSSFANATAGQNGGVAINFNSPATLINNGTIAGGGGGGGGNTGSFVDSELAETYYADGGGGAGLPPGSAGGEAGVGAFVYPDVGASDGTKTNGGFRSLGVPDDEDPGGNGGNRGQAGVSPTTGKAGGAAGYCYQLGTGITVNYSGSGLLLGSVLA